MLEVRLVHRSVPSDLNLQCIRRRKCLALELCRGPPPLSLKQYTLVAILAHPSPPLPTTFPTYPEDDVARKTASIEPKAK